MGSEPNRVTLDELVSYNLRRAREMRGWTQAEAADRVSEHLGRSWSEQVYGDAERAYRNPKRVKVFTGEEMLALAQAFELPIPWFYVPPAIEVEVGARGAAGSVSGRELLWLLVPETHPNAERLARASAFRKRTEDLEREAGFAPGQGDLPVALGIEDYRQAARPRGPQAVTADQINETDRRLEQFFDAARNSKDANEFFLALRHLGGAPVTEQQGREA